MKEVLIVGSGVSAWSAAIVFAKKNIKVRVLSKNDEVFGAQQLSPSGFNYLN
jgi:succinate dehydrogenase/fumarate reductase flavoprotein subunit